MPSSSLVFPGRVQGLPVELVIEGSPGDPWVLPPDEDLRIARLVAGEWTLRVSWHGEEIFSGAIEVRDETERELPLPPGCIEGQDEEAWRRAGREYPP